MSSKIIIRFKMNASFLMQDFINIMYILLKHENFPILFCGLGHVKIDAEQCFTMQLWILWYWMGFRLSTGYRLVLPDYTTYL